MALAEKVTWAPASEPAAREGTRGADRWLMAGMVATPLRWVTGWMFFSAFWRRSVLAPAKLDPTSTSWNGKKINDFLPHSLGIGNGLEYLVTHPGLLQVFLVAFTVVEALVGVAMLLGLLTRLAALGTALLSFGILLGSGWLGTTCLDEWQIGAVGVAGSLTVLLAGAGPWSLDRVWTARFPALAQRPLVRYATTGPWGRGEGSRSFPRVAVVLAVGALLLTLATNQAFAGGVWGTLHNDSKAPHLTLSNATVDAGGDVGVRIYRDGGPDTYGAFVVSAVVRDGSGSPVETFGAEALAALPRTSVRNYYVNKIKPGPHALLVPLAAKADVELAPAAPAHLLPGRYEIVLTDVSGTSWSTTARVRG